MCVLYVCVEWHKILSANHRFIEYLLLLLFFGVEKKNYGEKKWSAVSPCLDGIHIHTHKHTALLMVFISKLFFFTSMLHLFHFLCCSFSGRGQAIIVTNNVSSGHGIKKKYPVPINREQTKTEVKIKSHMTNESQWWKKKNGNPFDSKAEHKR